MPITADYKWEDSQDVIAVLVPLRGAKLSGEQVFMSNEYVKAADPCETAPLFRREPSLTHPVWRQVNSAPYFLELDLAGSIDAAASRAICSRDGLRLHLHKAEAGSWDQLVTSLPKKEKIARREASVAARSD